jgi:Holliday junction resolvasome RuvABC endonuclease subunit
MHAKNTPSMSKKLRCLALDLSRKSTGWAFGDLSDSHLRVGHFAVTGSNWGEMALSFEATLMNLIRDYAPALILYEAPIVLHNRAGQTLAGLAFMAEYVAAREKILAAPVNNMTAKKTFCGFAYSKKNVPYPGIVKCRELGITTDSTDEADAVAIWFTAQEWISTGQIEVE